MADGSPTKVIRHAPGVRGALPHPRKSADDLARHRAQVEGLSQRDAVAKLRAQGLTLEQCGLVLGVDKSRIARILKPQGAIPGQVWVRCTRCVWRGRRMIDSHGPCGGCGAPSEAVVLVSAVLWLKIPIDVEAAPLLGADPVREAARIVQAEVARRARRVDPK